ncbi:MAG: DUF177 domain-containing protein [Candidatus Latescibacterota bacterium]|nr:DUF177 domain-containing protein [Candidatus Latescibacterota bacterium]
MVGTPQTREQAHVLQLDDIEEGLHEIHFEIGADALEVAPKDLQFSGPLQVRLTVGRTLQYFCIEGHIEAQVQGECCRCLEPAQQQISGIMKLMLQRKEADEDELEAIADEDEVDIVDPGTRKYDLGERVRDVIVLEIPLRLYCAKDCQGLCSSCGRNLNEGSCDCSDSTVDTRWEALAQLNENKN